MSATTYTDQQQYAKFLKDKTCSEAGHPEGCTCSSSGDDDCGCCPAGLVAVTDSNGKVVGCLTPNDAELYNKNTLVCQTGYAKLVNNTTGEVLGCVSEDSFAALYAIINPAS